MERCNANPVLKRVPTFVAAAGVASKEPRQPQNTATTTLGAQQFQAASPENGRSIFDTLGFRLTSLLRVALVLSALLMAQHVQSLLFVLLLAYAAYGVIVHGLVLYRDSLLHLRLWHWLDIAWSTAVIAASGGDGIYYLLFLYPITTASLQRSTGEGVAVTFAAAGGWLMVALSGVDRDLDTARWLQLIPQTAGLLVLGYAIALWSGFAAQQRKRLLLLGELNQLPNPRFGPDRLIAATIEQLRDFYRAENCVAVFSGDDGQRIHWAKADGTATAASSGTAGQAEALLSLPEHCTVLANDSVPWLPFADGRTHIDGIADEEEDSAARTCCHDLTKMLGTGSWISIPIELRGVACGRLYVVSRQCRFAAADIWLLRQAIEKVMPLVESVKLIDQLATNAAEKERQKISLDLHDSAIQPYLGLKLGLEALRRKISPNSALAGDIDDLCRMTIDSIAELRGYVGGLSNRSQQNITPLMAGLQMQVDRFRGFYGIEATVNLESDLHLNDRLATEVVQMIGESLSNVGRHTSSRQVSIDLSSNDNHVVARIVNHGGTNDAPWQPFTPRSLTRRAQHLGGSVEVARQECGGTAVLVSIPL